MSSRSVRKCINEILSSLREEEFDRFVHELVNREQEPPVLLDRVEKKKRWEVTDVMVDTFTDNPAVDVAKELLEQMHLGNKAQRLVELARTCGYEPAPGPGDAAEAAPPPVTPGDDVERMETLSFLH